MGIYLWMSSIGGVVGAPLLEILSTHYGWRGALVIVSAVVMNTVACGLIYRETRSTDDDEAKPLCPKSSNSIKHNPIKCKPSRTCLKDNSLATQASYTDGYANQGSLAYTNWGQETNCNKDLSDNDPTCHINDDNKNILDKNGYATFTRSSEEDQINKSGWLAYHINKYQLLLQPVFICYLLSRLLSRGSRTVMYQYTPSKALADGNSEIEASLLNSIGSVMGMIGRMASTFISSTDHANRCVFGFVTMLLNAVFSLGFSLSHNYLFSLISMSLICLCAGEY